MFLFLSYRLVKQGDLVSLKWQTVITRQMTQISDQSDILKRETLAGHSAFYADILLVRHEFLPNEEATQATNSITYDQAFLFWAKVLFFVRSPKKKNA